MSPSKSGNSSLLAEWRKEVICSARTLQMVTFPAYQSLRKTAGALGEKTQNLNYRGMRD
jgi:hypothetical protein